jgi:hypothetical protein
MLVLNAEISDRASYGTSLAKVDKHYLDRWIEVVIKTLATNFAWCMMFSAKWSVHTIIRSQGYPSLPNSCIQRVIVAVMISSASFTLMSVLDCCSDSDVTDEKADKAIEEIIVSIGILVGFSWEQSFDAGIEVLAELTKEYDERYPVYAKLACGVCCSIIMIPAWRRHIFKKSIQLSKDIASSSDKYCSKCVADRARDVPAEWQNAIEKVEFPFGAKFCHECGKYRKSFAYTEIPNASK